jgi:cysteinyl-tRNA synthetase
LFDVLGLQKQEAISSADDSKVDGLMQAIIELRAEAKQKRDLSTADFIRERLSALDIQLMDSKEGTSWQKK